MQTFCPAAHSLPFYTVYLLSIEGYYLNQLYLLVCDEKKNSLIFLLMFSHIFISSQMLNSKWYLVFILYNIRESILCVLYSMLCDGK